MSQPNGWRAYTVGARYSERIPSFPEGMHVMGLSAERLEVICAFRNLAPEEVEGFLRGPFEVGIWSAGELAVLLARCAPSRGWMDAPYDARMQVLAERKRLAPPAPRASIVPWILVEADTGVILGQRVATLSARFMAEVARVVALQLANLSGVGGYNRAVDAYQARYQPEDLARLATVTEVLGVDVPPAGPDAPDVEELSRRYPALDPRVWEVMAEALGMGAARIAARGDEDWWVDPEFGPDVPVLQLGYDDTLGMVDRRRFPEDGKT